MNSPKSYNIIWGPAENKTKHKDSGVLDGLNFDLAYHAQAVALVLEVHLFEHFGPSVDKRNDGRIAE